MSTHSNDKRKIKKEKPYLGLDFNKLQVSEKQPDENTKVSMIGILEAENELQKMSIC